MYQRFEAVTLEITKKCNHECMFCYNLANTNSSDVTFEKIDAVVEKLYKYGIERVTVTGGEPYMVRPKAEYLIKKLLKKDFDVCLNTNLTLMNDDAAAFLEKTIGHDNVIYSSIPSVDEQKCDKITRRFGSYRRIIRGIDICNKHNLKVGLNMSVSEINIDDIDKIPDFLRKHPVHSFTLFPVIPPVYDRDNIEHTNDTHNLKKVADMLVQISEEFGIIVGSIRPLPRCIVGDDEKYNIIIGNKCTTGCERFAIDMVSGEMEACSQEEKKYGNIYTGSIENCFENMKSWQEDKFLANTCKGCEKLETCGGMCLWSEPCGRC